MKQAMVIDLINNKVPASKETLLCARQQVKKKGRFRFATKDEAEEMVTYEEVGLYYPRANHKKPIMLIRSPNHRCEELGEVLTQDAGRFAPAPF